MNYTQFFLSKDLIKRIRQCNFHKILCSSFGLWQTKPAEGPGSVAVLQTCDDKGIHGLKPKPNVENEGKHQWIIE